MLIRKFPQDNSIFDSPLRLRKADPFFLTKVDLRID